MEKRPHATHGRSDEFKYGITPRMDVQMNSKMFDPFDSILIIGFFYIFMVTCDNNATHHGMEMGLIPYFTKKSTAAVLPARLLLKSNNPHEDVKKLRKFSLPFI